MGVVDLPFWLVAWGLCLVLVCYQSSTSSDAYKPVMTTHLARASETHNHNVAGQIKS
jgi:hypothetical protein